MKKLDSNQDKELLLEELKHLRKKNKKLASQKDKIKAKYDKTKKELKKKRRSENNIDRRTKSITLEPVPGHRFPLVVIQLCVSIYMRTPCGLLVAGRLYLLMNSCERTDCKGPSLAMAERRAAWLSVSES